MFENALYPLIQKYLASLYTNRNKSRIKEMMSTSYNPPKTASPKIIKIVRPEPIPNEKANSSANEENAGWKYRRTRIWAAGAFSAWERS